MSKNSSEYEVGQLLYRAEMYVSVYTQRLTMHTFEVVRLTPAGAWIRVHVPEGQSIVGVPEGMGVERWIGINTKYCAVREDLALHSLRLRTQAYVGHARRRYDTARRKLDAVLEATGGEDHARSGSLFE